MAFAYNSYHYQKKHQEIKEYKATTNEWAIGFSENKFNTTFDAIWKHSVPSSHILVFHYTSFQHAVNARKSGIPAQKRFNGVPLTLRQPHKAIQSDFAIFGEENELKPKEFPHEEVLVLSLPKQFLDPLPGYEDDDGLCMISSQVLNAMRSTSFTAVMNSQPWLNGYCLLPPHCILRSFLIMEKSDPSAQRLLSINKSYRNSSVLFKNISSRISLRKSAEEMTEIVESNPITGLLPMSSQRNSLWQIQSKDRSPVLAFKGTQNAETVRVVFIDSIDTYIKAMSKIRQKAFERKLVPLYHYTSRSVASLILQSGLRMSSQGQGDGGVYVSTLGPASYGLGTDDYEV
eukprot:CAMPEP_0114328780 /NCGR_PEP_ID=MMETSP0101-20121206/631_1 /TAXON_ID=38822 ORGANISM="Pteridomonas danica, Strain PT" /NCGR_SAMPLE_ID=MMETSP0101 /ASSEMBLY_ACC=CAM_ASM_000211 /LENGTH=344 /DNA_ID=CAMNT_0001458209 /DNA_START=3088 /DNA_END=4118 /DNA_ORIENTATION=+